MATISVVLATIAEGAQNILLLGGFVLGFVFGAITIATNFCTMGAIADIVISGDYRRFRSWVLAAAIALIGAQLLYATEFADLGSSIYLSGGFAGVSILLGGLVFGFGMALAGGCPSRNLVRAGSGDLRAVTTLMVMGICAYIAIGGLLGPLRSLLQAWTTVPVRAGATSSIADIVAGGAAPPALRLGLAIGLSVALLLYCLADKGFRSSPRHVAAGLGVGACCIAGWALTAFAYDEFAASPAVPASIGFVRPVADSLDYLMRSTAMSLPGFGVATVAGCIAGALAVAVWTGRFRIRGFADHADSLRHLAGGALMGIGGVVALGCSIGQGVTGVSTMAAGSFIAFAAMAFGTVIGVKYLGRHA